MSRSFTDSYLFYPFHLPTPPPHPDPLPVLNANEHDQTVKLGRMKHQSYTPTFAFTLLMQIHATLIHSVEKTQNDFVSIVPFLTDSLKRPHTLALYTVNWGNFDWWDSFDRSDSFVKGATVPIQNRILFSLPVHLWKLMTYVRACVFICY